MTSITNMTSNACLRFVVRRLPAAGLDGAFRIHINPDFLDQVGLSIGDICEVLDENSDSVGHGIAWRATERMGTNPKVRPVKMTEAMMGSFGIKEGSHIKLSKTDVKVIHAEKVRT